MTEISAIGKEVGPPQVFEGASSRFGKIHRSEDHRRAGREGGVTVAKDFYFKETLE